MMRPAREVLVLHNDVVLGGYLRKAAALEGWRVRRTESWEELADQVTATPASSSVVVDPYFGVDPGDGPSIELVALLNRFPSLTVTAALAVVSGRLDDLRRLGEWGVAQVLDLEEEATAWGIRHRLLEVRGRPLINLMESVLPAYTTAAARSLLRAATAVVVEGGLGRELARALHVTPRTLLRWCRKAGLPPPRRLLAWMRMMIAAELLDDPGRSVLDVALACGYASDGSLRNAMKNFVGESPGRLRELGAFEIVAGEFTASLRIARSPKARYRAKTSIISDAQKQSR